MSHGAELLRLIRDGIVTDWESLCYNYGVSPEIITQFHVRLYQELQSLKKAGLIEFDDHQERNWSDRYRVYGPIKVSKSWDAIQTALGVKLADLAELVPWRAMIVKPYFGLPKHPPKGTEIFILMPFAPELKPVYEDHITLVCNNLDLTVSRSDDIFTTQSIMSDRARAS